MDAKLKKIQIIPMKFNKEGDVQKEEFATLTFEIPLDGLSQKEEVMELFDLLSREWVKVQVEGKPVPLGEGGQPGAIV
ncbi:hypothetical protein IH992_11640 [Candidatus Poribacteria bacterium]|nr:hypothetical protein [Candidatus Poribacteria bacterium]